MDEEVVRPAGRKVIEIKPENLDRLVDVFKLFDPDQKGLGLGDIRIAFPREGWHYILDHVDVLVDTGRLTKQAVTGRDGLVSHEVYTWQAAQNA
jgi:hypothetical protein